jgi:hypothetical protein
LCQIATTHKRGASIAPMQDKATFGSRRDDRR